MLCLPSSRPCGSILGLAAVLLIASCSGDTPTSSERPPGRPISIGITPSQGLPLTPLIIQGLQPGQIDVTKSAVLIDGRVATLRQDAAGVYHTNVPAIADSAGSWPEAPHGLLSVAIVHVVRGDTLAFGADLLTVLPLVEAPGIMDALLADWQTIAGSLRTLVATLDDGPGLADQVGSSSIIALEAVLSGSDPLALAQVMDRMRSEQPAHARLMDALLSASGIAEQTSAYAEVFTAMAAGAAARRQAKLAAGPAEPVSDEDLAYKMQMQAVIRQFGSTVVTPTAQTYALVTGALGIIGNVPYASAVGAVLSLADFICNKFVVALLPAKIDSISLHFAPNDTIALGERTDATGIIHAANDPPGITVQDVIGLILNSLGTASSLTEAQRLNALDDFREVLLNVTNYMLGVFQQGIGNYAGRHPDLNLDPSIASIPRMEWSAVIVRPKFYEFRSFTPGILVPIANDINWESSGPDWGAGRVYIATTADPAAVVVPQPPGFAYSGGAFGEEIGRTETRSIWVRPELVLRIELPALAQEGVAEEMQIDAGYLDLQGSTIWSPGVQIQLQAAGGSTQATSGVTGANGRFTTMIQRSAGSPGVTVRALGSGDVGARAEATATVGDGIRIDRHYTELIARADARPHDDRVEHFYLLHRDFTPQTWSYEIEDVTSGASATASGNGSVSSTLTSAGLQISANGSVAVFATAGDLEPYAEALASRSTVVDFRVGSTMAYTFTGTLPAPAGSSAAVFWERRENGGLVEIFRFHEAGSHSISGTLPPGKYELEVNYQRSVRAYPGRTVSQSGQLDFEFAVQP